MNATRRDAISKLYHEALSRTPDQRARFLFDECRGDEELRAEVDSLLRYEAQAVDFLEAAVLPRTPESSMIGREIGPYVIVSPLGAGGMGEVFRARDSRLGRDVAIKILPSHLIADPDRRARLAREARLLATLNHPNIGAIYEIEESADMTALVLELVEGSTLSTCLQGRPLRIAAALTIARQVAEALDAAHQKGIVHRDLKPANIVLQGKPTSSDVVAKVLDFGLAKTFAGLSDQPLPGLKETGVDITATGGILGTPAYMSPEQARGDDVDKRTDIWSFGCVLYEMICGRRAFAGTSTTETLEGVLERDPDWTALPRSTPDIIRRLLRHCLQKEVGNRARDMGDVRLQLTDALTERTPTVQGRSRGWRAVAERVLAVSAIPIVATFLWLQLQDTPSPLPLRLSRLTFEDGFQTDPALSPDGKFLAYATDRNGNFDIYTQPIEGGKAVRVTDSPAHDWEPSWSAGGQIVFRSERDGGGLYVVSPTGGSERRLTTFGRRPLWSPDGVRVPSSTVATQGSCTPWGLTEVPPSRSRPGTAEPMGGPAIRTRPRCSWRARIRNTNRSCTQSILTTDLFNGGPSTPTFVPHSASCGSVSDVRRLRGRRTERPSTSLAGAGTPWHSGSWT